MFKNKTLRLKLDRALLERIEDIANEDGVSLNSWIVDALHNQVRLWEVDQVRDAIAMEEIEREILIKGQSAPIKPEGVKEVGCCEMCMEEIVLTPEHVDGPYFCSKCMEISKGGDFSELST